MWFEPSVSLNGWDRRVPEEGTGELPLPLASGLPLATSLHLLHSHFTNGDDGTVPPIKQMKSRDEKAGITNNKHFQLCRMKISGYQAAILPVSDHTPKLDCCKTAPFSPNEMFPCHFQWSNSASIRIFFSRLFRKERIGCDHTIFSQTLTCSNLGTRQLILPHQTKEERPEVLSFLMFCDKQAVHPKMDRPVAHMLRDSLQCKLNRNTRQQGIHIKASQRKIIFLSFMDHKITFLFVDRWWEVVPFQQILPALRHFVFTSLSKLFLGYQNTVCNVHPPEQTTVSALTPN